MKLSKCSFDIQSVEYLGYIISTISVAVGPSKLQAMVEWPSPRFLSALQGFLGFTGYDRCFIRYYAMKGVDRSENTMEAW
ncbi:UNVERIFIED_CONTAM: hypothetical protein Slati_3965200 [Sesamum latifolium]|uniref:Mitochondrial protein n=1 Tax=Sesamum latifolium TaxID=2727402 RepID=A0AAW2TNL6_9LAMI